MSERLKTTGFVAGAIMLAIIAAVVQPERRTPGIMSDQGELFYPKFIDPQAAKTIEVVDYDETTATARPLQVEFQKNRWTIATHNNYPVDAGERLAKTAGALIDMKKDQVRSDSVQDHAKYGVIDPLDSKVSSLTGRGKRVTLRDAHKEVLADYIFGKAVDGKVGFRYVRVPGGKRVYVVKTEADPSGKFADWVNAGLLRIAASSMRRISILSYSIDERMGQLSNMENVTLTQESGQWKSSGGEKVDTGAVNAMVSTLDSLKIVDARPKPQPLAEQLRSGALALSLEIAMSLRQKGFYISPNGRLLSNEGEMTVDTSSGVAYSLRFGEVATDSETRYLFVTTGFSPERAAKYGDTSGAGERLSRDLNSRFADWYYVISGADFRKLRLKKKDIFR